MENKNLSPAADIHFRTSLNLPFSLIEDSRPVVPYAAELSAPGPARLGFVRHGGVLRAMSHVSSAFKPSYERHVADYYRSLDEGGRLQSRSILAVGTRNSYQNLLLPVYIDGRLIAREDEPWQTEIYSAAIKFASGRVAIEKIRFEALPNGAVLPVAESGESVVWAVVGQRLLANRELCPTALIQASSYDQRHIVHLPWESDQPGCETYKPMHDDLMEALMANLSRPATERAGVLASITARHGLAPETGYLHSSIGISRDSVVWLAMTGSVTDHAREHLMLGCSDCILLDNGGSVAAGVIPKRKAIAADILSDAPPSVRFFGNGSYFRPAAIATIVFALKNDIVERPFRELPRASDPWTWDSADSVRA